MTEKSVQYKQVQTVAHLPHLNVYVYIEKDSPSFLPRIGHLTKLYICLIYHVGHKYPHALPNRVKLGQVMRAACHQQTLR